MKDIQIPKSQHKTQTIWKAKGIFPQPPNPLTSLTGMFSSENCLDEHQDIEFERTINTVKQFKYQDLKI